MLKSLIKKQYKEIFRGYFVNQKTGKARSKAGSAGMILLFAALMVFLGVAFFGLSAIFADAFFPVGLNWLYYSMMGTLSILLGTFGSVFSTYSGLYVAKDNELLLSMPIPPLYILISRMSATFGMSLLYSGIVWVPACIMGGLAAADMTGTALPAAALVWDIVFIFIIAAFVTVITCILGWLVAIISSRVKKKSAFTVIFSLAFFFGYYYFFMRLSDVVALIKTNSEAVGNGIKTWANIIYRLGAGAAGDNLSAVIFTSVTLVLFALCIFVLSKTFTKIVTRTSPTEKSVKSPAAAKAKSISSALLRKEAKRFTSSSIYMLNCGLGAVILPIIAVIALVKRNSFFEAMTQIGNEFPDVNFAGIIPLVVLFALGSVLSMGIITTPSVSLEGKNLWLVHSLPVSGAEVLSAKLKLHIIVMSPSAVVSAALLSYAFGLEAVEIFLMAIFAYLFTEYVGAAGLIIGVKKPNLSWTNETVPIKQSLSVLLSMLWGFVSIIVLCAAGYFLGKYVSMTEFLTGIIVVSALAVRFMKRWLYTSGAKAFEAL